MFMFFSGATRVALHQHGRTEMGSLVMMDRNAQDQTHVRTVNVEESVLNATLYVNTAMEVVVV